ncbi:MAG TPA: FAD-dependent monooxygenase, partial [Ktedonobacteraceae bacterium]|nr:FAD-dependent monooxygenase [Ktedonobacteraceae bacterium]
MGDSSFAVVIVGAGPVGLAAANLLGMAGIETLVIERNAEVYAFPRAIALDDEGLRVCQSLDLMNEVLAHIRLDVKAHYVTAGRFLARAEPTGRRNGFPLI